MGICAVHRCAECGKVAGILDLGLDAGKTKLVITEFNGTDTISADSFELIREAIEKADPRPVHAFDASYVPFYCVECNRCYCWEHWRKRVAFDPDFAGWYDCTYGVCPQGHERIIDD